MKRKPTQDARTELYHALDLLEEVLEHELDHAERADLIASLERVRNTTTDEDYRNLAEELLHFLSSPKFNSGEKILFISDHVSILINRAKKPLDLQPGIALLLRCIITSTWHLYDDLSFSNFLVHANTR